MSEHGDHGVEHQPNPEISVEQMRDLERRATALVVRPKDVALGLGLTEASHTWTTTYETDDRRVIVDIPEPGYAGEDREDETTFIVNEALDLPHPAGHIFTRSRTYKISSEFGRASVQERTHEFTADGTKVRQPRVEGLSMKEIVEEAANRDDAERQLGLDRVHESDYKQLIAVIEAMSPEDIV